MGFNSGFKGLRTSLLSTLNERGGKHVDLKGQRPVDSFCVGGNERNICDLCQTKGTNTIFDKSVKCVY